MRCTSDYSVLTTDMFLSWLKDKPMFDLERSQLVQCWSSMWKMCPSNKIKMRLDGAGILTMLSWTDAH